VNLPVVLGGFDHVLARKGHTDTAMKTLASSFLRGPFREKRAILDHRGMEGR
jgi:hypothetical protein